MSNTVVIFLWLADFRHLPGISGHVAFAHSLSSVAILIDGVFEFRPPGAANRNTCVTSAAVIATWTRMMAKVNCLIIFTKRPRRIPVPTPPGQRAIDAEERPVAGSAHYSFISRTGTPDDKLVKGQREYQPPLWHASLPLRPDDKRGRQNFLHLQNSNVISSYPTNRSRQTGFLLNGQQQQSRRAKPGRIFLERLLPFRSRCPTVSPPFESRRPSGRSCR